MPPVYQPNLRELAPPQEGAREQPEVVDHEGGEEKPEELAEQLQVVPTVSDEALGMEDKEGPPADREEHGQGGGDEDGVPARGLQPTQHLPRPALG